MSSYTSCWVEDQAARHTGSAAAAIHRASPAKHKRALAEMDVNAEMGTPKRRAASNAKVGTPGDAPFDIPTTDTTPRPVSRIPLLSDAPEPPDFRQTKRARDHIDSESSAHSSTASGSKKSRRSESPQKEMALRGMNIQYPVAQASLVNPEDLTSAPEDVRSLAELMYSVKDSVDILPRAANTPEWRAALTSGSDQRDQRNFQTLFRADDPANDHVDFLPDKTHLCELVEEARENMIRFASEPAWNSSVHHPLLNTSLRGARHNFRFDNITTARIVPAALLPVPADTSQSRKVDFCLTFKVPDDIKRRLGARDIHLNQTDYTPLLLDAIVASIETKLPGEGRADGMRQLMTWAQAQVTRLRQLLKEFGRPDAGIVEIPVMPLLFVQGHEWHFLCFKDVAGENMATFYSDGVLIGSTTSLLETCKVVAGLRVLIKWADDVWWPWLRREILDNITDAARVVP
ncbi:unnamed protein product [Zymoseptoria tritici ST99CH_3D1]|nr:unnamed protein product [Zymoseptoria tritici ST99CH_3D1]